MIPQAFGKWIIATGILLILIGIAVSACGKLPLLGRLPGDLMIRRGQTTVFLPITSCILLSIAITLLLRLFRP